MINDLLFVYGTLLIEDNQFARYLSANATFYCVGKIKGKFYDIGSYPGVIVTGDDDYDISGTVYQLNNVEEVLRYLDPYEGFGEGEDLPYLFMREALPIKTEKGTISCWIYLYNRPVDGLSQITSGDYQAYLKQK
jgi:gamma-glutamylcyclotransferase (GGCT)/AIG2-like uncharacterized protein YtfP